MSLTELSFYWIFYLFIFFCELVVLPTCSQYWYQTTSVVLLRKLVRKLLKYSGKTFKVAQNNMSTKYLNPL